MDIKKTKVAYKGLKHISDTSGNNMWFLSYLLLAISGITLFLLLKLQVFEYIGKYRVLLQKVSLLLGIAAFILAGTKVIERIWLRRTKVASTRYNLMKMIRLLSWLLVVAVAISFLFKNWYSAAVSLGLISLILGFALQTPISSFIGWLYILIRQPYHIGDRIQIDTFRGDVVEVNYLDTTLWEFSGDYLTNDIPSGRLIRFPNSIILESPVFNYSWQKFPFIWNEIPFHVAYNSDLPFVTETIKKIAVKLIGDDTSENIEKFKNLVQQTPVDGETIRENPFVSYRINTNTWVEVTVTYLVDPKHAAMTRTKLISAILDALNKHPEKVQFPAGNNR